MYLIESSSTVDSNYWLWVYLIESSSTVDSNYWLWVYLMKVHPRLIVVHVTRSLVLCVCFVDRCLSFCTVSFGHCVVFFFSIYRLWLSLWYLQTLFSGVRVSWSLVLCVCFVDRCLSFCPFSIGHNVVCPAIYVSD